VSTRRAAFGVPTIAIASGAACNREPALLRQVKKIGLVNNV